MAGPQAGVAPTPTREAPDVETSRFATPTPRRVVSQTTAQLFADVVQNFHLRQTRVMAEGRKLYCVAAWQDTRERHHTVDLCVMLHPEVCPRCQGEGPCDDCHGHGMVLMPAESDARSGSIVHSAIVTWNAMHPLVPYRAGS